MDVYLDHWGTDEKSRQMMLNYNLLFTENYFTVHLMCAYYVVNREHVWMPIVY